MNSCFSVIVFFISMFCDQMETFGDLVNLDRNKDYFIVSCFWLIASSLVTKS